MQYLFDTNAVIYYLEGREFDFISDTDNIFISCITNIELLSGKLSDKEIEKTDNFIKYSIISYIDEEIIKTAIEIRKNINSRYLMQ